MLLALFVGGAAQGAPQRATIFAINDLHGNLQPPPGGVAVADPAHPGTRANLAAGGVARMAALLKQLRVRHPDAAFVAAGDLIGASPLLSGLFHDEPTVEALSQMGLEASAVGNHEFDKGAAELLRIQKGGCPSESCNGQPAFAGARYHYLAANVVKTDGAPLLPPYYIRQFGGIPVAFVGVVLKEAAAIVTPSGVAGLSFRDEADSVNALVPELRARGIEAIVVLIHQGANNTGERNDCKGGGPVFDIVRRLDKAVDVVVSGHTHQAYNCVVDGRLLTSAHRYGTMVTEIDLTLDRASHDVISAKADNLLVRPELKPDPAIARLIARTEVRAAAVSNRVVATLAAVPSPALGTNGESAMGDLVADGMLAATPGGQIAFTNTGGIRSAIAKPGPLTHGELFAVLPFGNKVMAMDLTGAQIKALLEQQWSGGAASILQISHGFSYRWDASRPVGDRVLADSMALDGETLAPQRTYRVVTSDFLGAGGSDMTLLRQGTNRVVGKDQMESVADYLGVHSPYVPGTPNRIGRVN
jgi:5'-nucleotidase